MSVEVRAQSQKEIISTLNRVSDQLIRGNVSALDDVKALPPDHDVGALMMYFKDHYYLNKPTTAQKAIAAKAALYVTECPTASKWISNLFKKEPGRKISGLLLNVRKATLDCLTAANNPFAVRTLVALFDETELEVPPTDFAVALAKMNLPNAPFSRDTARSAKSFNAVAKWKEWWETNKAAYGS